MDAEKRGALIELVLEDEAASTPPTRIDGVLVGTVVSIDEDGTPRVSFDGRSDALRARSLVQVTAEHLDRDVALMFEGSDPERPIVMGLMFVPRRAVEPAAQVTTASTTPTVQADGERLVFSAEREIVLKCGESSITLTRAGKILIKGAYLSSRSTGVNRIQGGSVQIN